MGSDLEGEEMGLWRCSGARSNFHMYRHTFLSHPDTQTAAVTQRWGGQSEAGGAGDGGTSEPMSQLLGVESQTDRGQELNSSPALPPSPPHSHPRKPSDSLRRIPGGILHSVNFQIYVLR